MKTLLSPLEGTRSRLPFVQYHAFKEPIGIGKRTISVEVGFILGKIGFAIFTRKIVFTMLVEAATTYAAGIKP